MRHRTKTKVRMPPPDTASAELGEFLRGWVQAASIRGVKPLKRSEAFDRGWETGCWAFADAAGGERERLGLEPQRR